MSVCLPASALLCFLSLLSAPCYLGGGTPLSSILPLGPQAISQLREKPILHLLFSVWALVGSTDVTGEREKYCGPQGGGDGRGAVPSFRCRHRAWGRSVELTAPPVGVSVL